MLAHIHYSLMSVTAPADNLAAPPGYYQLFLVDTRGVPSVGRMVRVSTESPHMRKILSMSDLWKYDDRGVDQGEQWLAADFDDSTWKEGAGQLGYGDGDEGTVLTPGSPTVYFRKKLVLDSAVTSARLEALYDDGIAVWVNGVPVFSRNMARGTEFGAWASASVTNAYERAVLPLSPNPFRVGENVVTAMVKQVAPSSTDLSFALSLELALAVTPARDSLVLTAPTGGEAFQPGSSTSITWSSTGLVPGVDLALSTNDGASWTPLASGLSNTGMFKWTVPDVNTPAARVRVSRFGNPSISDTSRGVFSIHRPSSVVVVPFQSTWRYDDSGQDPGPLWTLKDFDDSTWKEGAGQLGCGDGDERTLLMCMLPAQTSFYFRKTFTVDEPILEAHLRVLFDDGLAVYLNGVQVFARNVDKGVSHEKYASASTENELDSSTLPASLFVPGENTLAVVVKQNGPTSPDLSFDLELQLGLSLKP